MPGMMPHTILPLAREGRRIQRMRLVAPIHQVVNRPMACRVSHDGHSGHPSTDTCRRSAKPLRQKTKQFCQADGELLHVEALRQATKKLWQTVESPGMWKQSSAGEKRAFPGACEAPGHAERKLSR